MPHLRPTETRQTIPSMVSLSCLTGQADSLVVLNIFAALSEHLYRPLIIPFRLLPADLMTDLSNDALWLQLYITSPFPHSGVLEF